MYSRRIVAKSRERLDRALHAQKLPPLREYSLTETSDFEDALSEVVWPEEGSAETLASLPQAAQDYIRNSLLLSQIDFEYWCERFCTISSSTADLVKLHLRKGQRFILDRWAEMEESNYPLREGKVGLVIAKARRAGATVISQAAIAHGVMLRPNAEGFTASNEPAKTLALYDIQERIYDNLPGWMKPHIIGRVKKEHFKFDLLDSKLDFGSGAQKNPMGQGLRKDFIHLTEVSTWQYPKQIDSDLLPGFLGSEAPTCLFVLESTGEGGVGNFFYETYQAAKREKGFFRPLFIGWHHVDQHSTPSEGVTISPAVIKMAERIKREQGFECSKDQLAWYELARQQYESKGDLQRLLAEYPSTDDEAFQSGIRSVFPLELRNETRDACRQPLMVCEWDEERGKFGPNQASLWNSLPEERRVMDQKLFVWESPKKGALYVVGVDVSQGLEEGDPAAVEVIRVGNTRERDEQVAEWSGLTSPRVLAHIAYQMGDLFKDRSDGQQALMAVELNGPGQVTQMVLEQLGYYNFYFWRDPFNAKKRMTTQMGWVTNARTRTIMTKQGVDFLKSRELVVNSPRVVTEMDTYTLVMNSTGSQIIYDHAPGCHDDRLMALFIAFYVAHENDLIDMAEERRIEEDREERRRLSGQEERPSLQSLAVFNGEPVTSENMWQIWLEHYTPRSH